MYQKNDWKNQSLASCWCFLPRCSGDAGDMLSIRKALLNASLPGATVFFPAPSHRFSSLLLYAKVAIGMTVGLGSRCGQEEADKLGLTLNVPLLAAKL